MAATINSEAEATRPLPYIPDFFKFNLYPTGAGI
jgi:hypothetical protein